MPHTWAIYKPYGHINWRSGLLGTAPIDSHMHITRLTSWQQFPRSLAHHHHPQKKNHAHGVSMAENSDRELVTRPYTQTNPPPLFPLFSDCVVFLLI